MELVVAAFQDRWERAASLVDGPLVAASCLESSDRAQSDCDRCARALGRPRRRVQRWLRFSYLHEHHYAIFAPSSQAFSACAQRLRWPAERRTGSGRSRPRSRLAARDQPARDMQVNGHLFQVKTSITSLPQARARSSPPLHRQIAAPRRC